MITMNKNIQSEISMTTMEEIAPEDSLFCKIDKYIDFTFIQVLDGTTFYTDSTHKKANANKNNDKVIKIAKERRNIST